MIRNACMSIAVVLAAATAGYGQEWARKMFETTSHDFGMVARGAKVDYVFKLSNLYLEDVHIASVRSSCGCTSPVITKDTLKTYEEGGILASFNTNSFLGQKSATVTVTIDKPFYAEVQLQVSGYIRSDVVLSPGSVALGTIDAGTPIEKKIVVNYAGRPDWQILDVKIPSPYIEASITETSRHGGQVSYQLTVRLKDTAPSGYVKDQIFLVTNDARDPEFPVDVEGRINAELSISPASLYLGTLQAGQKVTKQLVVQGKKPFRILDIHCNIPGLEFKVPEDVKTVHLVPVTFVAGEQSGKIQCKIVIETDLGGDTPELPAYAMVVAKK